MRSAARQPDAGAGQSKTKRRIVVKLSGRIFSEEEPTELAKFADLLFELSENDVQPIAIAGGGKFARHYIQMARKFGQDEASLDMLGIEVSRLNAKLLSAAIESRDFDNPRVYHTVPTDLEQVFAAASSGKIVVTGGLHPGQSTNATAALIAEKVRAAEFLNATDVDGIYDSDPRKNRNAKMFKEISVTRCMELLSSENASAGSYDLMDIVALKVIERSKIPTLVLKSDTSLLRNAVLLGNNQNSGTRIIP